VVLNAFDLSHREPTASLRKSPETAVLFGGVTRALQKANGEAGVWHKALGKMKGRKPWTRKSGFNALLVKNHRQELNVAPSKLTDQSCSFESGSTASTLVLRLRGLHLRRWPWWSKRMAASPSSFRQQAWNQCAASGRASHITCSFQA